MPLSLYTKVMQPMQHFCIKNVACNDTLGAKRYISKTAAAFQTVKCTSTITYSIIFSITRIIPEIF